MATIKNHTDIEQSKKLAEILPLETADMKYISFRHKDDTIEWIPQLGTPSKYDIPCWSLAALLGVINTINGWYPGIYSQVDEDNLWQICMFSYETGSDISTAVVQKELVDTCYEVILKLKEKGLL